MESRAWVSAAAVTASFAMLEVGIPREEPHGLVPSFVMALVCSIYASSLPMRKPYVDGSLRPPSRGVFHAALGAALWVYFCREVRRPSCTWEHAFLFFMNAACLSASAWFHCAPPTTRRLHDRRLFVDVVFAGLPMIAMLFVFRSNTEDVAASVAFMACLGTASYREIILRATDLEVCRSLTIVVYFAYVEYASFFGSGTAWFAGQAVAFALCFATLVYVDDRRKRTKKPVFMPHHSDAWTAHEDAHVLLGIAQCFVFHRSVCRHAL